MIVLYHGKDCPQTDFIIPRNTFTLYHIFDIIITNIDNFLNIFPPTTLFCCNSPPKKIWVPHNPAKRDMRDKPHTASRRAKRKGGVGEMNFCPPAPKAKPRRPARSEQKPAKKFSLHFLFCARPFFSSKRKRKLFCWLASVSERRRGGFRFRGRFPAQKRFAHFQTKGTSKNFASVLVSPRFARRLICIQFWGQKRIGGFVWGKENF